ncbi:MAG TPA: transporter substrate-binding domain-containing protein [Sedimenticola thiotaurini]|uniref:Transporter substrate-binding domain-containing protein n=1 Tax=Sedimenticola thiotaurini TaxID=1543721 RepID=A0A831W9P7_9GAMM|nr:transporter substrate-binding domain-containing protein [Sedimenticola thiotaurini]
MNARPPGTALLSWLVALLLISAPSLATSAHTGAGDHDIRVGIYLNPPLSYPGVDGRRPTGFIVDLLDAIARQEGWTLEFVSCKWDECNQLLKTGGIDMLAPIAVDDAEKRGYDYNRESLYVNWGQIVIPKGETLESPLDLAGKSVIALSGDVHFADLKELAHRFDIDVRFLEVDDYESVLAWVANGPVDAGLVNRTLDLDQYPQFKLERSPVIFNPAEIRIALSPHNDQLENAIRIQRIDYNLTRLKGTRGSLYYQLQERWFGKKGGPVLPEWAIWAFLVIAGIALLLSVSVLVLRRQVRHQTRRIQQISDRFSAFMNNLPGIAYMKGGDGRYIFVNPVWEQTKHLNSDQVVGRLPEEIWPDNELDPHTAEEQQAIEQRQVVESIETSPWDDLSRYWRLIRFPIVESSGDQVMVGGVGLDITAQREAEERLSHLNRQLQLLLDSAGEGIFGLDGMGRCNFINQEALDLLGYRHEEVINANLHDLIQHSREDGSLYPEVESPIHRAIREGRKFRITDEVFWRGDGTSFPVEYSVHPIADGEYPGAVVVFHRREE